MGEVELDPLSVDFLNWPSSLRGWAFVGVICTAANPSVREETSKEGREEGEEGEEEAGEAGEGEETVLLALMNWPLDPLGGVE